MKSIALCFTAALLATPVFADDLCTVNLQKLDDHMATQTALAAPLKNQIDQHKMNAEKARDAGDMDGCTAQSAKALQLLEAPGDNGQGGS